MNTEKDFWERVCVRGPDVCWPWRGPTRKGYGHFHFRGKNTGAHRLALEFSGVPNPGGMHALHDPVKCNNRGCCNPAHLRWGTHRNNIEDLMRRKGWANFRHKTVCINGHEMTPDNTYLHRNDHKCRKCRNNAKTRRRAALKGRDPADL